MQSERYRWAEHTVCRERGTGGPSTQCAEREVQVGRVHSVQRERGTGGPSTQCAEREVQVG